MMKAAKLAYYGIFRKTDSGKYYLKTVRNSDGQPFMTEADATATKKLHYKDCEVLPLSSPLLKD